MVGMISEKAKYEMWFPRLSTGPTVDFGYQKLGEGTKANQIAANTA